MAEGRWKLCTGFVCLFTLLVPRLIVADQSTTEAIVATACQLMYDSEHYSGKLIHIRAELYPGIEDSPTVLVTDQCSTAGHLIGVVLLEKSAVRDRVHRKLLKLLKNARRVEATMVGRLQPGTIQIGGTGIALQSRFVVESVSDVRSLSIGSKTKN